jgi:hypothetical protein
VVTSRVAASWRRSAPSLVIGAWICFLGLALWQRAAHSAQPPVYDGISYLSKAAGVWAAIHRGEPFNPFGIEPVVRPPGTVLMSHPFGFTPTHQGYHFRSVFLPILLIVLAVRIAEGRGGRSGSRAYEVLATLLFSSLPMFYHLDFEEGVGGPSAWGLVDNFQAGCAALSMAALMRGVSSRSHRWIGAATALSSFALLIKPSGLMVMAIVAGVLFVWGVRAARADPSGPTRRFFVVALARMLAVFVAVTIACVLGGYLSDRTLDYARKVLDLVRTLPSVPLARIPAMFHQVTGEAIVVWLALLAGLLWARRATARQLEPAHNDDAFAWLAATPAIWVLGVWYWQYVQAGAGQVRYFFPFLLMGLVCSLPAGRLAWSLSPPAFRALLGLVCVAPSLMVAGLLSSGDAPPATLQRLAGVTLTVGQHRIEVAQARAFVEDIRRRGGPSPLVYSFARRIPSTLFENVGAHEAVLRPGSPTFRTVIPVDWVRGFAVRTEEIETADYILIGKRTEEETRSLLSLRDAPNFDVEADVFEAWLGSVDDPSMLAVASDGPKLRLLAIRDPVALTQALEAFVAGRTWRPEFHAANPPSWWDPSDLASRMKFPVAAIDFEGVYLLHGLRLTRSSAELKVEAWWEETRHEDLNASRYLFLHLVDERGAILQNLQIPLFPYEPPDRRRRARYSAVSYTAVDERVRFLGFGVFSPNAAVPLRLAAERTDWNGHRGLTLLP